LNNRVTQYTPIKSVINPLVDSTRIKNFTERNGAQHNISISASPKMGYVSFSPFLSYRELWYSKSIRQDSVSVKDVSGFNAVRTFALGVSTATRFYGIVQPMVLGVTGIRHTVSPSATFSYAPDFSEEQWGYYGTFINKSGQKEKYSYHKREIFGGAGMGKQQNLSLSVSNIFEAKYLPSDSGAKEQKVQLFNVDASFSYNFVADSMNLSRMNVSYRTQIGSLLNLSGFTTYDFYTYDETANRRINKFLWDEKRKIADLVSFSVSMSTSLQGSKKQSKQRSTQQTQMSPQETAISPKRQLYRGIYQQEEPDFSIPWNLSLSFNFSQSQENPKIKYRTSTLNANLSFNLTEKWQFQASGNYDLIRKELAATSLSINRDLHCWLLTFSWIPLGPYRSYRLEIRVKAPQLSDIKVTKEGSARGVY
jgi:hypothetical protein